MSTNRATDRRRSWRPVLAMVAAVAVVLALRLVAPRLAPEPAAPPAPTDGTTRAADQPDRPVGVRLLLAADDRLFHVDVDTGAVRAVPVGGVALGAVDRRLVRHHGTVIVVRDRVAYALSARLDRPAVRLGRASFVVPSSRADRAWLVEQAPDPDRWFTVREVRLDGKPTLPARTLPLGRTPRAGVPRGLLISALGEASGLAVWEPRTGHTWPLGPNSASFVAARDGLVAWMAGGRLHLTDMRGQRDRVVAALPGMGDLEAAGAFSPDGGMLALTVPSALGASSLVLVDVRRARVSRVKGADLVLSAGCDPCLSWSPAGHDLFFARVGPTFGVGVYRLGAPRATLLPLQVPSVSPPSILAL